MKHLTRSAVNVFAVLENFNNGTGDILDSLAPFFEPILLERRGEIYDPSIVASDVRSAYKWNFTSDIAEEFIPRFETRGWIKKENPELDYCPYVIVLEERKLHSEEVEVLNEFDQIAKSFHTFAKNLSPLTTIHESNDQYKEILIEWLLYVDAYSEANLDVFIETYKDENKTIKKHAKIPNTTSLTTDEIYLCARFVEKAVLSENRVSETLCKVASIGLLTEVVQDFYKPSNTITQTDLVVYLDAPIALELLGVSGRAAKENIEPIINELQKIGANIRVFGQSLVEMSNNLNAVLTSTTPTGPTAKAMASGDVLRSLVQDVANDPEFHLNELSIKVLHRTLDQFPGEKEFFTDEQYNELYDSLTFQINPTPREHDTSVTTLVMRQRRGRGSKDIFKSHFILLTRNGPFSQQARKSCVELGALPSNYISPVVHRRVIATSVWLRTGLGPNRDQIPKRLLLASCERVLAIKEGVVKRVKTFSDTLNEDKAIQLDLLLSKDRSTQLLMDKTLGVSGVITEENFSELFDEMLSPFLEDEQRKGQENVAKAVQDAEKQLKKQKDKTTQEVKEKQHIKKTLRSREDEDLQTVDRLCQEVSGLLKRSKQQKQVIVLIVAMILMGLLFLNTSTYVTWLMFLAGVPITYLTLTGSSAISVGHSNKKAMRRLSNVATDRALDKKMKRYNITWSGESFVISQTENGQKEIGKLI